MTLTEVTDRTRWDEFVVANPYGHPLQLWGWGVAKSESGWTAVHLADTKGDQYQSGAEVLLWKVPKLGKEIAYIPRGPIVQPGTPAATQLLSELVIWAKQRKVLYLRIEPAWTEGKPGKGWIQSRHHVQLPETYVIDLSLSPEEIMAPMSHKHRQYIRKAERDGVTIRRGGTADIEAVYEIYQATARRAQFGIHGVGYYRQLLEELGEHNYLYVGEAEGSPVAFLWLAAAGSTAYELYGGVATRGGELKANYFLKWRAIEEMKLEGYTKYDFNGRLNEGVSRFKEGFGPVLTDYTGTWDYPVSKIGYQVWERLWPVAKPVGRWLARARVKSRARD